MAKYLVRIACMMYVSADVEVEAESEEDAIDLVEERAREGDIKWEGDGQTDEDWVTEVIESDEEDALEE